MEIKQLEYFVAAVDHGSLNRAAEQLYTTQPNVSRVIHCLERELKTSLLVRSNKGIRMTEQGEMLYRNAVHILRHSHIIRSLAASQGAAKFGVSGYQSSLLTKLLVELYKGNGERSELHYEYREGTVEEITDDVANHISEIGIVYLANAQMPCFRHIIGHKKLEFFPLDNRGICIYVGKYHPLYERESVDFSELRGLKFVEETDDFFAMEHHIERVSVGAVMIEHMNNVFSTNSDYMINNLLLHTDVCCMGVDFVSGDYGKYDIKALKVKHCEPFLSIGYVTLAGRNLSDEAKRYIDALKQALDGEQK